MTKGKQWIRLNKIWNYWIHRNFVGRKFEDQMVGLRLALIGAIKDEILNIDELSLELIKVLTRDYAGILTERYGVDETQTPVKILEQIAENRKCISKEPIDYSKAARLDR